MEPEAFKTPIKPATAGKRKIALQLSSPSPNKIPRGNKHHTAGKRKIASSSPHLAQSR